MKLFQDNNGNTSSKRVMGYIVIVNAIIMMYLDDYNASLIETLVWAGVALLGVGVAELMAKKNKE